MESQTILNKAFQRYEDFNLDPEQAQKFIERYTFYSI